MKIIYFIMNKFTYTNYIVVGSENQCPEKLSYSPSVDMPRFQQLKQVRFPAIQRTGLIQPFLTKQSW